MDAGPAELGLRSLMVSGACGVASLPQSGTLVAPGKQGRYPYGVAL
jgi:hypothetical protein